jgi:FlaA1/EpsC-like NDP-sugar epimerase
MAGSEQSGGKVAPFWRRFLRDGSFDFILLSVGLFLARIVSTNLVADPHMWRYAAISVGAVALPVSFFLYWRGVYRSYARYIGLYDFLNIATAGIPVFVLTALVDWSTVRAPQWDHALLAALVSIGFLIAYRLVERTGAWRTLSSFSPTLQRRRTLIVGAGDAGETVMREISRLRHPTHQVVGFVDDDPAKANLLIHGLPVIGNTHHIQALIESERVDEVLIAIPSADGANMRRIVNVCNQSNARVRTLPSVSSLLAGGANLFHYLRDVEIEDLLRRKPVRAVTDPSTRYLQGENVLITGGGGSIGSELGRQIARLNPANLTLLGKGENSVFEIEQELIREAGYQPITVIADVRDRQGIELSFQRYRPTIVFHAAAHKHVPLMQANPIEAIKNNIFGTLNTAEAAIRHGAKKFIYVSTDKAVNPSSVMGATKRVGEMIVAALARRSETEFAVVRFGNVLGSRGSIVPMIKSQIRKGGPVRITHKDMTRYFMTIPEAVQLIMSAGAMGHMGEIFILNMGEPVKIVDLVTDLIRLHGLVPGEDVEIKFTGVRPGEKIHEELVYAEESLSQSEHPDISRVANVLPWDWEVLRQELRELQAICDAGDQDEARQFLMELAWGKKTPPIAMQDVARDVDPAA